MREEEKKEEEDNREETRGEDMEEELVDNVDQSNRDSPATYEAAIISHLLVIFSASAFEQCPQGSKQHFVTPLPCHACECECVGGGACGCRCL